MTTSISKQLVFALVMSVIITACASPTPSAETVTPEPNWRGIQGLVPYPTPSVESGDWRRFLRSPVPYNGKEVIVLKMIHIEGSLRAVNLLVEGESVWVQGDVIALGWFSRDENNLTSQRYDAPLPHSGVLQLLNYSWLDPQDYAFEVVMPEPTPSAEDEMVEEAWDRVLPVIADTTNPLHESLLWANDFMPAEKCEVLREEYAGLPWVWELTPEVCRPTYVATYGEIAFPIQGPLDELPFRLVYPWEVEESTPLQCGTKQIQGFTISVTRNEFLAAGDYDYIPYRESYELVISVNDKWWTLAPGGIALKFERESFLLPENCN